MGICCMTQGTQPGALWQSRRVELGGRFRSEGSWVYLWLVLVDVWQKTTKFCKAIILQLNKIILKNINIKGEGNGSPLQCSCLEDPRDGGAWWAAVHGVTQSQTRLKWLSSSSSIHMSPHSLTSLPSLIPLGWYRAPVWVPWVIQQIPIGYLFYIWYYKFPCYSPYISPSPSSPPLCPAICSLCLFLHCCPENEFINILFLDSIYVSVYNIYISLSDLLHSV